MNRIGRTGLGITMAFALAACHQTAGGSSPQPGTVPAPPPTVCQADGARWAIGEHATERLAARARMASGAETVRVVYPDEAHTMEFDQNRLNLEVDDGSVVQEVRCG